MRTSTGLVLACLLLCVACGDDGVTDAGVVLDAGGGVDAGATDSGIDAGEGVDGGWDAGSGSDGGANDAGASDAGASDAGAPDAGAGDAGPLDAGPAPTVTLRDVAVYANCMPVVAPDPVIAFWNVDVSGASGPTATLIDAKLTVTGSATFMQTLTVDTPSFPLSGGGGSQAQRKTGADVVPPLACGELCSGATFTLELTIDAGGYVTNVMETGSFGCVY